MKRKRNKNKKKNAEPQPDISALEIFSRGGSLPQRIAVSTQKKRGGNSDRAEGLISGIDESDWLQVSSSFPV